jgi:large subunit ribosomal protein L9
MQIILIKSVRKLGKVGTIVNVKNGYGRNYLIPQEFAIRATKDNIAKFDSLQKKLIKSNEENRDIAEKAATSIKGKNLIFIAQSSPDGRLFGSVNAKDLAVKLSELVNIPLNYTNILMDSPIKLNGVYEIQVILHPEVITNILVVVAKTESEAQDALREFQENNKKSQEEKDQAII